MKWIGQHIWSFISRFRSDVYLEDLSDAGSDTDKFLVADSDGKVGYRTGTEVLSDIGGASTASDVTGITLSGDTGSASDTSGNLDLTIAGGNAISTTASSTTVTIDHSDTSSASSVNNSGSTVVQDITIDTYGHVTALASATLDLGDSLSFDGNTADGICTYKDADEISVESTLTYTSDVLLHSIAATGNAGGYLQTITTGSGWQTGNNTATGIHLQFNKDDNTQAFASGGGATWYGLKNDASDTASNNVGNTYLCGVLNDLDFASANGDFAVTCGIENDLDGGDTQYGIFSNLSGATAGATFGIYQTITDGGYDLYFRSSADNSNYAYWQTGAAAATTIATVGADEEAHLTLDIAGDIYHDSRTGIHKWFTNGNNVDFFGITVGSNGDTTITTTDASGGAAANLQITANGTAELAGTTVTLDSAANIELEVGGATNYINTSGVYRGGNIGTIQDNRILVSPTTFIANSYRYHPQYSIAGNGITMPSASYNAYTEVIIPYGYKATSCTMHAVDSDNDGTIQCYEGHLQGGATSAVAAASTFSSGTVTHDFGSNDIDGDGLKTCIIVWNPGDVADTLQGGWITIEKIT